MIIKHQKKFEKSENIELAVNNARDKQDLGDSRNKEKDADISNWKSCDLNISNNTSKKEKIYFIIIE